MKTIIFHLVELQSVFGIVIAFAALILILAFMLAVKNSRYKALKGELLYEKSTRELLWNDLKLSVTQNKDLLLEIDSLKAALRNADVSLSGMIDHWRSKYNDLYNSLPKPQPRTPDGKFVKGSERLDKLCKHLMAGGRTDRNHAQENFSIAYVHKYIALLKKEGFVIRKSRRKISEGNHLTEYYLAPEKGPRHWAAQAAD